MKRLLAEEHLPSDDAQLAELLRSAAPFEIDPFRKRRILVRIERGSATRKWSFWLRPAVALTLLISGSAAAAIGHHYAPPGTGFFGLSAPSNAAAPAARAASVRSAPHAAPMAEISVPNDVTPDATASTAPATSAAPAASNVSAPRPVAHAHPESSEDASNVVAAIQALRAGRDPARAQGLLNDYLKAHPHGVLSGDALALSMEAASAQNDPKAADYARRYLALYPKGKYRDLAKRALGQQH